jgi:hypothetical protein
MKYALEPYDEDHKNTSYRNWFDSSHMFHEKEASLQLSR